MLKDMSIVHIARLCHEVNRAYCNAIGDLSQLPWDEAPAWQKKSAVQGVLFHSANPETDPAEAHNNWMAEKRHEGWIYGLEKDTERKLHPCMLPYNQLPTTQQAKDYIFKAIVNTITQISDELLAEDCFEECPEED